jgi:glycosyltransferase involved in cell wall biosynthesis
MGLMPNDFVVLSPRICWPVFNIHIVIEAFALALRDCPQMRLLLITYKKERHPEYAAATIRSIDTLGIRHRVIVLDDVPQPRMPELYTAADCTISIPRTDGTPMTVAESWACGTPVVIGDLPDYDPQQYKHCDTVLRVDLDRVADVASKMRTLYADVLLRTRLRARGLAMAQQHFDQDFEMRRLETLYFALAESGRKRRGLKIRTLGPDAGSL